MEHIHAKTGLKFEVGFMPDYDMSIIMKWNDEGEFMSTELIDYYFGEYDKQTTDNYIDRWLSEK